MTGWALWALVGVARAQEAEEPTVASPSPREVAIDEEGNIYLDGQPITRDQLRSTAREPAPAGGAQAWAIAADPDAQNADVYWVMSVLKRTGATDITMTLREVEPPAPPEPDASSGAVATSVAERAPAQARTVPWVVRPTGELRFDLAALRLDALGDEQKGGAFDLAFRVPRAVLGFQGELGEHVGMRSTINVVEKHGTTTYDIETAGGDTAQLDVTTYPDGTSVRLRDVYVDIDAMGDDRYVLRAGVQAPVFSTRDFFDSPERGYDTAGPLYETVPQVAGVVLSRDLGVSATARFLGDRGVLQAMLSNGTERAMGEDNDSKDLQGRLAYGFTDAFRVLVSGTYGLRGGKGEGALAAADLALEYRADRFALLAECFDGTDDDDTSDEDAQRFQGAQAAGRLEVARPGGLLDRVVVVGRFGYYDPQAGVVDYDTWMLWNAAVQGWWATARDTAFLSSVGYQVLVPIDLTADVEHSLVLQARWAF